MASLFRDRRKAGGENAPRDLGRKMEMKGTRQDDPGLKAWSGIVHAASGADSRGAEPSSDGADMTASATIVKLTFLHCGKKIGQRNHQGSIQGRRSVSKVQALRGWLCICQ